MIVSTLHPEQTCALHARFFILATGGIENARLLLASQDLCPRGLGNEHDQVGRYFMNHPKNYYGILTLKRPIRESTYFFGCLKEGYAGYAGLRLSEDFQKRHHLLNSYIRFEPLFPWSNNQGIEAAIFLMKKMQTLFQWWRRLKSKESIPLRDYSETGDDSDLQNQPKGVLDWMRLFLLIFLNLPRIFQYLHSRFLSRKAPLIRKIRLRNFIEMEPREENRVLLSLSKNRLGQPLAKVNYATSELDQKSLIALHAELRKEFEEQGLGPLDSHLESAQPWPIDQDASHHLGATRMGKDPLTSVVNENLRLHSVTNVYVAGGSVFPVSGCANPTYTICALSIRLAEHLKKVL